MMHGLTRGLIAQAQGGTFKSGFLSGFTSSAFSVGKRGYGGFTARTAIIVVGGTASKLGGDKFSNGAVSGAFVHMFNAEGGVFSRIWKGLRSSMSKLNDRKYEIIDDAGKGFKGNLKGYRKIMNEENPRQPKFIKHMVKTGLTAIESGATAGFGPLLSAYANHLTGFASDSYAWTNPISFVTDVVASETSVDRRIFK